MPARSLSVRGGATATTTAPLSLLDVLKARPAMLALVEPDYRYARRLVAAATRGLKLGTGSQLEWTGSQGWQGATELLGRLGLEVGRGMASDPSADITSLTAALESSRERAASGRDALMKNSLITLYDCSSYLNEPSMQGALAEMAEATGALETTALLVISDALPEKHPLHSILLTYQPPADPGERYGALVHALMERLEGSAKEADVRTACEELKGLPLVAADFVCRLLVMDPALRATGRPLAERLRESRARYNQISGREG